MSRTDPIPGASAVPAWHILIEFVLASEAESGSFIGEQTEQAVLALHLPTSQIERLKTALREAAVNALERSSRFRPSATVAIRLLLSERARSMVQADEEETREAQKSSSSTRLSSRGWGFFIIERFAAEASNAQGYTTTVELFLYLESERVMD